MLNSRPKQIIAGLVLALTSNILMLGPFSADLKLVGWLLLSCFVPGYLWVAVLLPVKPSGTQSGLAHFVLSVAVSMALSVVSVLSLQWLPGELTLGRILFGHNLLVVMATAVALAWPRQPATESASCGYPFSRRAIFGLAAILLLGAALRTVNLAYSEFQDDEVDIVQVSLQAIQGDKAAVLNDVRGPARTMLAASAFLATGRVGEVDVRWPITLASITGILAIFCIGQRLFGPPVGLLAAAVVAAEGITVGYGRIVQQESLVNLLIASAVLCFLLAGRSPDRPTSDTYRIFGICLLTVGLLAHYEVALIVPVLLWLWISDEGWSFFRRSWRAIAIGGGIFIAVLGSFYTPFLLSPSFGETYRHYSSDVLGSGLANNIRTFSIVSTFYNSVYFVVVLGLLFVLAFSFALSDRRPWLRWLCGLGSLSLWGLSFVYPEAMVLPGLLWFGGLTIAIVLQRRSQSNGASPYAMALRMQSPGSFKVALLWLMMYFIPYLFIVGLPRMHYYTFTLPWSLVAACGLYTLWGISKHRAARVALVLLLVACYALAVYHDGVFFVSHTPEWAMTQPERPVPLHPRLHDARPAELFGFPQKSGWKTIAALYRQGILRGPYETNELHQKANWYLRRLIRQPGQNRYYFIAESPHRPQAGPPPEAFVPEDYRLVGTVTVAGEPKLRIFERREPGTVESAKAVTYNNELFESRPDATRTLDTYRLWWNYQADDQFFLELAQHLEAVGQPEDGLVLIHPAQVELLSTYYRGALPYYPLMAQGHTAQDMAETLQRAASAHARLFAAFWAVEAVDPEHRAERWLDEHLFKADERWFGNIRLAVYATPGDRAREASSEVNVRFGEQITLLNYGLPQQTFQGGEVLPLRLFWRLTGSSTPDESYKVFVHILDSQGQIGAQRDSEPAGGSRPTNTWRPGDELVDNQGVLLPKDLPAGEYRIAIGLYDPLSGLRLPAVDAAGQPVPDGRVMLGVIRIEGP